MQRVALSPKELETLLEPFQKGGLAVHGILPLLESYARLGHTPSIAQLYCSIPFPTAPHAKYYPQGIRKQCYKNAANLAISDKSLTYVEGWAFSGLIPVEHAWCVDARGNVVDTTWGYEPDTQYLGVPVHTRYLIDYLLEKGVYGIFGTPHSMSFLLNDYLSAIPEPWLAQIVERPRPAALTAIGVY